MIVRDEGQVVKLMEHDDAVAIGLVLDREDHGTVARHAVVTGNLDGDLGNDAQTPADDFGIAAQTAHQQSPARHQD